MQKDTLDVRWCIGVHGGVTVWWCMVVYGGVWVHCSKVVYGGAIIHALVAALASLRATTRM